jgi:hypothetical protein
LVAGDDHSPGQCQRRREILVDLPVGDPGPVSDQIVDPVSVPTHKNDV